MARGNLRRDPPQYWRKKSASISQGRAVIEIFSRGSNPVKSMPERSARCLPLAATKEGKYRARTLEKKVTSAEGGRKRAGKKGWFSAE